MEKPENNSYNWIQILAQFSSLLILLYIFAAHLIHLLRPTEMLIDRNVFDPSFLRRLFSWAYFLGLIAWTYSLFKKNLNFIHPLTLPLEEKITTGLTAFFLAIFYNPFFTNLKLFQYPVFIGVFFFFFFTIPQIIYLHLQLTHKVLLKKIHNIYKAGKTFLVNTPSLIKERRVKIRMPHHAFLFVIKKIPYLIFLTVSLFTIFLSYRVAFTRINDYRKGGFYRENLKRAKLHIEQVSPDKAIGDQLVTLLGFNFKWRQEGDPRYRLMSSDGPIEPIEEWTNEKLTFKIPLYLIPGRKQIWIERPGDEPKSKKIIKSNFMRLEVYSRFVFYPDLDDTRLTRLIKRVKRTLFFDVKIFNNWLFTSYE